MRSRAVLLCLLVWLLAGARTVQGATGRSAEPVGPQADIQHLIERPASAGGHLEDLRLRAIYAKRHFAPLWSARGKVTSQAAALLHAMRRAEDHGLIASDYDVDAVVRLLARPSAERFASFDVALSILATHFLEDLHQGRIDPHAAGFELPESRPPLDLGPLLTLIATTDNVPAAVDSVEPPFLHYRLLKAALRRYRRLAAQSGLTDLPRPRTPVKPGAEYPGAPALRRLLHAVGDLPAIAGSSRELDPRLVKALRRFQMRHGLPPSGVLDRATYAALTVPLAQRVRQIELTLERWRWLPPFETPPIIVNIPQFRLFAFRSTQDLRDSILQMDVIVGQRYPKKQTPVFAADMRYVVFRPYWDIPPSIVENELLAHIRANPRYLATQRLEIIRGDSDEKATVLPPTPANVAALAAGRLRLRQLPGPDNALGLIKFMFPNTHDVYLHSTPAHGLFKETRRDFSHGCIRVSDPVALAVQVLRDTPGDWTREKVVAAMNSGPGNRRVNLAHPIRVFILYATVLATEDGSVLFFDDLYGHDRELETLLHLPPVAAPKPAAPLARDRASAARHTAHEAAGTRRPASEVRMHERLRKV